MSLFGQARGVAVDYLARWRKGGRQDADLGLAIGQFEFDGLNQEFVPAYGFHLGGAAPGACQVRDLRMGTCLAAAACDRGRQLFDHQLRILRKGVFGGAGKGELEGIALDAGIFPDPDYDAHHAFGALVFRRALHLLHEPLSQRQFMHAGSLALFPEKGSREWMFRLRINWIDKLEVLLFASILPI